MLSRLTARIAPIAVLGAILAVGVVPAHASLIIALQEDAGPITLVMTAADFTSVSFSGTFGDFNIKIDGASSDNGAAKSDLLSSDNEVQNMSSATHTLMVWASQNNYTLPAGSLLQVESSMGGSVNTPTLTLSNIFQAYADKNNNLLGTPFPGPAITDFTNGAQTATLNGTAFDTGSAFGLFTRAGDYSLTTVANIRLTAGGDMNFSAHENLTAVPEPSTMAIAGLGVLGLIGYGLRRRRA
jgi:MYXO-CTERM domain-containing protein